MHYKICNKCFTCVDEVACLHVLFALEETASARNSTNHRRHKKQSQSAQEIATSVM